jgi:hypothetical protein
MNLIIVVIGCLAVLICLLGAFRNFQRKRLIDDIPTSKTQGVFIGLTELKGTAESENPLTSYLAGIPCVLHNWIIEEHWTRTVHETYTDSKGHTQTRTRTESGWKQVSSGGQSGPFYLKDETGILRIVPEGASINSLTVFNEIYHPDHSVYFGKGPAQEIANSDHRRRFHETAIPLHAMLYVMGQAMERQDVVAAEIAQDKSAPVFLISIRSEKQISRGFGFWFGFFILLALVLAMGSAAGWILLQKPASDAGNIPFVIALAAFLMVLFLGWIWTVYNSLINLHHRVQQGWSQVDVQLKRRHDLIPNLVQTVEGYRSHESETQQLLAELRRQGSLAPSGVSSPDFKGLAPLLRVVIERYPELKANESFLKLLNSLVDTEQRIALARDYYNDAVTFYNTRLGIIPDRFAASLAKLRPETLSGAADFERAPVTVKLAS